MTDQEAFDNLSNPIRHFIRKKGWTSFRPIQRAAIERILSSDKNYILASRTASGKTEAAFLPILSKVDFTQSGVQVLYISPLIALINDQINRVEELCQYIDVPITKWHGEANKSDKKKLLKDPRGIVLITPESLEAMFVNHPEYILTLFANLKYIIVDEVHYFIGTDRGLQLQSLIHRIQKKNRTHIPIIGLSATIGDFTLAKNFTNDPSNTSVLLDSSRKPIIAKFKYFKQNGKELPIELIKDIFRTNYGHKTLIFPNCRSVVEEISVKLKILAEKTNTHKNYFSHHASIDKKEREYIEFFAKNSIDTPFSICCTSTLELGIDIGNVDMITQVNATHSVSSLIQRAGRSGRKDNTAANLNVYSTNPMSLVRAIACWNLHEQGIIESPSPNQKPYDILVHQILSIVKETNEIYLEEIINTVLSIPAFTNISTSECYDIIQFLQKKDKQILETIDSKIIIGIDGEKIVNSVDFYSVFQPEKNLCVCYKGQTIGELQPDISLYIGQKVFLSAKIWTIEEIDFNRMKIYVSPAVNGKPPKYSSGNICIDRIIEQEMLHILYSKKQYSFIDEDCSLVLNNIRNEFSHIHCFNMPVFEGTMDYNNKKNINCITLFLFFGTKTNAAIKLLCKLKWPNIVEYDTTIDLPIDYDQLNDCLTEIVDFSDEKIQTYLEQKLISNPWFIYRCSKYGSLLPLNYQVKLLLQKVYNIKEARICLSELLKHLKEK